MRQPENIKTLVLSLLVIIALPITLAANDVENDTVTMDEQPNHQSQLQQKEKMSVMGETVEKNSEQQLTHEQIVAVTERFMDQLVQETDEYYNVKQFDTIEELKASFSDFAAEEVVNEFVDFYYEIRDGELKIVPTSTPPWFEADQEYTVEETEFGTYLVTQYTGNEMQGDYGIQFEFDLKDNNEPYMIDVSYLD